MPLPTHWRMLPNPTLAIKFHLRFQRDKSQMMESYTSILLSLELTLRTKARVTFLSYVTSLSFDCSSRLTLFQVDLADCSDDETYAEAIEKDDDDDGSREYSISPSGDAVNTSSMTIPLPNLAPDELNLFGWFDNKTASRVKNRLARALRPYVPPPPLPAGQKRPPGRPKKNPVPVPVATTPAKRGRPRKNPLPAPVTTPRKRGRPKKVVGSTTSLSATTAATTPVATTRTAHVWTTPTVRRARAASL